MARSVLSGDLSSFGLTDLFTLFGMGKKSGVLRLTRGAEARTLYWEGGEIVFARSNSVRASLGNFLVQTGIITSEQNAVSAAKIDEKTRHGKVLVRMGLISADQLLWAVKHQVLEIIYSLFHWRGGYFEFLEGAQESHEKITLSMSTTKIVMEGIHRLDEWAKIRSALPDDKVVLKPDRSPRDVSAHPDLSAEDKKVFPLVDGSRAVSEIVDLARLGEFECYSTLFRLLAMGVVRVSGARPPASRVAS